MTGSALSTLTFQLLFNSRSSFPSPVPLPREVSASEFPLLQVMNLCMCLSVSPIWGDGCWSWDPVSLMNLRLHDFSVCLAFYMLWGQSSVF